MPLETRDLEWRDTWHAVLGPPGYLDTSGGEEQVRLNELLGWSPLDEYVLRTGKVVHTMWREAS